MATRRLHPSDICGNWDPVATPEQTNISYLKYQYLSPRFFSGRTLPKYFSPKYLKSKYLSASFFLQMNIHLRKQWLPEADFQMRICAPRQRSEDERLKQKEIAKKKQKNLNSELPGGGDYHTFRLKATFARPEKINLRICLTFEAWKVSSGNLESLKVKVAAHLLT